MATSAHFRPSHAEKNDYKETLPWQGRERSRKLYVTEPLVDTDVNQACSDSWKAKDGGAGEGSFQGKSDTGLMGLTCRHDVCLCLINLTKGGRFIPHASLL